MCRQSHKKIRNILAPICENEITNSKISLGDWSTWLIVFSASLCYLNSLSCDLVFDDIPAIAENKDVRPETPLKDILFHDFWGTPMHREESHKSYRPLCVLTFRINYCLHNLQPFGYHLVNVMLHVAVCLLYYRFCFRFLPSKPSTVAALLFAVHPIHSEAVTGVVGRAELLSSIFYLLAFWKYVRLRTQSKIHGYKTILQFLLFLTLAVLSKEQGITIVAVCAAYEILLVQQVFRPPLLGAPRGKMKGPTPTWRKDLILRLLLLIMSSIAILTLRMKLMKDELPVFNKFDNPAAVVGWPARQLTHLYLTALNAWLLFFPADLCCDWTMGTVPIVQSLYDARVLAIFVLYSVICRLVWMSCRFKSQTRLRIIMGVSMCVFPFLPASNLFFPVGFVIAERILYIPSMGFCFLIAYGWHKLCLNNEKWKTILHFCVVILLCLHATKSILRNFDWKDEESLFRAGLRFTQKNAKLYNNLGHIMETRGKYSDALQLFLQATRVQPDDLGSHLNVGRMYNLLGLTEEAEKAFRLAKNLLPQKQIGKTYQTHIVPRHLDLFLNLGNLLSQNSSRLEEAQEVYKEAISMKADYIDAYMQRATVLLKLNRSEEALDMYKEALKYDQMNPDIPYNIGVLLLEQGKSLQAIVRFDHALKLNPEHEKALLNFAILTQDSGDPTLRRIAHERLQVFLDKGQQPERMYFNMGMLAMQESDISKAEYCFRKALQLRPDFDAALFNLALILYEKDRPLEALPYLQKLDKKHIKGLLLLGNIFFNNLSNYSASKQCYENILKYEPTNIPALHNLCAAHFQLGEVQASEDCLLRAATLAPDEIYIKHHLELVREHIKKMKNSDFQKTRTNGAYCAKLNGDCDMIYQNNRSKFPFILNKEIPKTEDKSNLKL